MIYQIITYDDNYIICGEDDPFFQSWMGNAQWFRKAPEFELAGVKSDANILEDIQGNKHTVNSNWHPADISEWEYKAFVEKKLTQTQVFEDTSGNYKVNAYYVSNHTFLVEVTAISSGEILAKSFTAFYEPRFGVDQADMQNILEAAEALCVAHESDNYKELLKVE